MGEILELLDYFFPREVAGAIITTLAAENVISALITATVPPHITALAWLVLFVVSIIVFGLWGVNDEVDSENLEEILDQ